jgi:(4S)-4-hydroxy-5-phosphonooxypentane-2,3-dione isomerase
MAEATPASDGALPMYVVTVEFEIRDTDLGTFMPLMRENARMSRTTEPGCRQFDVCSDPRRPTFVFLYELYDDRAAFEAHMVTQHFKSFDAATTTMIASKQVRLLQLDEP